MMYVPYFPSFRLPEGTYRFRGDYQGSQFWVTETILGNQVKSVNLNTGGGLFTLRVEKGAGVALVDKPVYVFTPSGSYLNLTAQTNAQGESTFGLAAGWYRFRVDYMGYQFWCDALEVPSTLSHTMSIQHRESTIVVNTFYTGAMAPLEGVQAYLFTEAGAYLNVNATTDAQGQVKFHVPDQSYKVRVDYLGGQYWSEVLRWQDRDVVIDEGEVDLHVTWNGTEVGNAAVYLFTDTGSYQNRNTSTDAQGHAKFTVPAKPYKLRIDYNGQQYWTELITPIAHQQLAIEVPLEQLALMPTNDPIQKRYDGYAPVYVGEPVKVASIGSLMGILSQTAVAQTFQPKVYYYLTDHLGTPQKVTDNAGAVVWSGDYRPFGEVLSGVSTIQSHFRLPGQYFDKESAFHYNLHRYYRPRTGRYLTPDPIGQAGGNLNLYSYVWNKPIRAYDPWGLWGEDVHSGIGNSTYGTYTWAMQLGFSQAQARKIAISNDATDGGFASWIPMLGLQSRHFNQKFGNPQAFEDSRRYWAMVELKRAVELYKKGNCDAAFGSLGKGLHSIQDMFAHRDWDPGVLGFDPHPEWYDEWSDPKNEKARELTETETKRLLEQFMRMTGGNDN